VPRMSYLVIEDFGTRGLCGDPARYEDPPPAGDGHHDFYWFWRNVGRSGKAGGDRGRWGVGKTVFPACSTINSMYGLTVQADTKRRLLMGQSVLKTHKIGATEYGPDGWFCDPAESDDLQMPFEDPAFISTFEKSFALKRGAEPGTSVVVPYPLDRVNASSILQSVVVHYFVQIVRGLLVVEVEGPGVAATIIDAGNIEAAANSMKWAGKRGEKKHVAPPIGLARFACQCAEAGKFTMLTEQNGAPVWNAALFGDKDLAALRENFESGMPVALRVPVDVIFNDKYLSLNAGALRQRWSHFDVFVQRSKHPSASQRGEDYFIRGGMTISGISTIPQARGVTALVLVDDDALTSFLGDAENPAHTDWREGEETLRKKYEKYHSRIRFVRNAVEKLIGVLALAKAGKDKQALADFFPIEIPNASQAGRKTRPKVPKLPDPRPKSFEVRQIQGGFVVAGRPQANLRTPTELHVAAAYELDNATGRAALRHYDERDFAFDRKGLTVVNERCEIRSAKRNIIELHKLLPDFQLRVTGFPETLDVVVRAVDPSSRTKAADLEDEASGKPAASERKGAEA
jgi:hypothetical protein